MLEATRLHCSVGIGDTKVRAKVATDFGKPGGVYRLARHSWMEVTGKAPDHRAVGRGQQIAERLAGLGIPRCASSSPDEPRSR